MTVRSRVVALVLVAAGCNSQGGSSVPAVQTAHVRLTPGTAALVGDTPLPVSLVADVARAQRVEPRVALDHLIADTLAAEGARASGEDRYPDTAWALESLLARASAARARLAMEAAGPPTDAEVAALTERNWREVDLPERVRVIHALIARPKESSKYDAARAVVAQLAAALPSAKSEDDFEAIAKSIPAGPFELHVERLPLFVQDGRTAEGEPMSMDAAFTRGAFVLKTPGETSGVVESPFGWHVIRLVERLPPKVVPLEERRARFADEIFARRGRDALEAVLAARHASTAIAIAPGVDALMASFSPGARQ